MHSNAFKPIKSTKHPSHVPRKPCHDNIVYSRIHTIYNIIRNKNYKEQEL